jgi:hypothetical protein
VAKLFIGIKETQAGVSCIKKRHCLPLVFFPSPRRPSPPKRQESLPYCIIYGAKLQNKTANGAIA